MKKGVYILLSVLIALSVIAGIAYHQLLYNDNDVTNIVLDAMPPEFFVGDIISVNKNVHYNNKDMIEYTVTLNETCTNRETDVPKDTPLKVYFEIDINKKVGDKVVVYYRSTDIINQTTIIADGMEAYWND